jgi:uncharacterized membrane protein
MDVGALLEVFKPLTLWLAAGAEAAAALIIGIATIEGTIRALLLFVPRLPGASAPSKAASHDEKEQIRLRLGRWLALALEFLLAADILRTAVAPTWNEIGQLAAIAVLRTALNYFLQREIDQAEIRERARAGREVPEAAG